MTTIGQKAAYVKSQGQTRDHHCHWPGCNKNVPPAMWGCKQHWFKLPAHLRAKIWATYKPGQEVDMTPSDAYIKVANEVQAWIAAAQQDKTHTDHPTRHWDRTCPACIAEAEQEKLQRDAENAEARNKVQPYRGTIK